MYLIKKLNGTVVVESAEFGSGEGGRREQWSLGRPAIPEPSNEVSLYPWPRGW